MSAAGGGWVRRAHRVVAAVFVLAVIANFAVMGRGDIAEWVGKATLLPLVLLMVSGIWMGVAPYLRKPTSRGHEMRHPAPAADHATHRG